MFSRRFFACFLLAFVVVSFSPARASLPEPRLGIIPDISRAYRGKLESLAGQAGIVGEFFKLKLAEKQLKSAQSSEALKTVSPVQEPVLSWWKTVIQAEIFLDQGKSHEALALLKKLPTKPKPELSYGEATYQNLFKRALITRIFAKQNLKQDFSKDVAKFSSLFPKDESLAKILGNTGESPIKFSPQNKIDKLHVLFFNGQLKDIPGIISVADIKSSPVKNDKKCRAFYELGSALKKNHLEQETSTEAFRGILSAACSEFYSARALYWLGMLSNDKNNMNSSEKYFTKLYQDFPDNRLADDAIYHLRQMAEKNQNASQEQKYRKMLTELKKGDMRCKFFFDEAYAHFKNKNFKQAANLFEKAIAAEPTEDESYPQVLYWHGRSLEKTDEKKLKNQAFKSYQRLLQEFPFSFYAVLAARRLGTTVDTPHLPKLSGKMPEMGIDYFALIDELNDKSHHEAASGILDLALHAHPEWQQTHQEYIAKKLIESRNYRKAIEMAAEHFDSGVYGPIKISTDPLFATFYPFAYPDKIKIGYTQSLLPQGVIEGIMREESLFQKNAKSWVGATGLMQLMPATAALVRKQLSGGLNLDPDLTDTETNIILGSTYLKDMQNYFDGQLPLAIMAYNAGPGHVRKWLKNFGNLELDEFIETIPLSETRGYVKRVMRSMDVYGKLLYHEPSGKKSVYFDFDIKGKK